MYCSITLVIPYARTITPLQLTTQPPLPPLSGCAPGVYWIPNGCDRVGGFHEKEPSAPISRLPNPSLTVISPPFGGGLAFVGGGPCLGCGGVIEKPQGWFWLFGFGGLYDVPPGPAWRVPETGLLALSVWGFASGSAIGTARALPAMSAREKAIRRAFI
jgi:hypothetical protein